MGNRCRTFVLQEHATPACRNHLLHPRPGAPRQAGMVDRTCSANNSSPPPKLFESVGGPGRKVGLALSQRAATKRSAARLPCDGIKAHPGRFSLYPVLPEHFFNPILLDAIGAYHGSHEFVVFTAVPIFQIIWTLDRSGPNVSLADNASRYEVFAHCGLGRQATVSYQSEIKSGKRARHERLYILKGQPRRITEPVRR